MQIYIRVRKKKDRGIRYRSKDRVRTFARVTPALLLLCTFPEMIGGFKV